MRVRLLLRIVAGLTVLSACGADPSAVAGPGSVPPVGTVDLVGGGTLDLARVIRDKPVVLWFWAPG